MQFRRFRYRKRRKRQNSIGLVRQEIPLLPLGRGRALHLWLRFFCFFQDKNPFGEKRDFAISRFRYSPEFLVTFQRKSRFLDVQSLFY
jgi:hypothetical protein